MLLQGLNGSWNRDVPFSGAGGGHKKGTQYVASTGLPQPLLPHAALQRRLPCMISCPPWNLAPSGQVLAALSKVPSFVVGIQSLCGTAFSSKF